MLRSVLAGRIPHDQLLSQRMYEVLELCVSCKACKSECPSSVDMAKIKTEFLAQYYTANPHPWRDHLFGHFTTVAKLASGPLAPFFNLGSQLPPIKWALEKALGISSQRNLPQFARQPFTTWFQQHTAPVSPSRQVVLFHDTLNTYVYPQVAIAATDVLEAVGCEVILAGVSDSGRPAYSKGLLTKSRQLAQAVLDALTPFAQANLPIIFLEPSDLSCITDDYASLLPQDERVTIVAAQSVSFEQYLSQQIERDEFANKFNHDAKQVLLHGHCHQKALIGTQPAHQTLTLPPNTTVHEVDSACCGMAGTFGYEAEHYDISLKMAERRLLPAVREASPDTFIVAAGISCRQQIQHGTGRQAYHPAEFLRACLSVSG